jgi:hypothetical protein
VTKACFDHSHVVQPTPAAAPSTSDLHMVGVGDEYATREDFIKSVHKRATQDVVELKIFVDLGKLSRRARFAMCCSHNSRTNAPKAKRCTYAFVAIEYEGIGW